MVDIDRAPHRRVPTCGRKAKNIAPTQSEQRLDRALPKASTTDHQPPIMILKSRSFQALAGAVPGFQFRKITNEFENNYGDDTALQPSSSTRSLQHIQCIHLL